MATRMLITKMVLRPDGKVDLYARGHRYKDLTLFDSSDLYDVGHDPAELQAGVETPCRFYAYYTESSKLNQSGNPYLDVDYLERTNGQASAPQAPVAGDAILAELQAVNAKLARLIQLVERALGQGSGGAGENSPPDADPPLNDDQARRAFGKEAGPAIQAGLIGYQTVNELTKSAAVNGWGDTYRELQTLIQQATQAPAPVEV